MLVNVRSVKETNLMHSRVVAFLLFVVSLCVASAADKPVFLYSRCFNAPGEARYLPDGNYKDLLQRLSNDFRVRVNGEPLNALSLRDVDVVLIANPSDKAAGTNPPPHHVDARDIKELTAFVERGGAMVVMGNQENHNLEVEHMNALLKQFGIQMTNLYTDAKLLPIPDGTPAIGGLKWAYYTGNLLLLDPNHPAKPRALVTNNLAIKPPKGTRDQAGALMAVANPGKGHVIVVTDSGWLADWAFDEKGVGGVALHGQDNYEIFRRLVKASTRRK
jgi:hypothetical protein